MKVFRSEVLQAVRKVEFRASGHQAAATGNRKRSWSSSNRDEQTPGTSGKHHQGDRFGGVGGTDGESGGSDSRRSGSYDGGNRGSGGNAGRTTGRSADWKMRGGNSGYGQYGRGGPQYYGSGSGGRASGNSGGGGNGSAGARGHFGGGGRGGRGMGGFNAGRGDYQLLSEPLKIPSGTIYSGRTIFLSQFSNRIYSHVMSSLYIKRKTIKM